MAVPEEPPVPVQLLLRVLAQFIGLLVFLLPSSAHIDRFLQLQPQDVEHTLAKNFILDPNNQPFCDETISKATEVTGY